MSVDFKLHVYMFNLVSHNYMQWSSGTSNEFGMFAGWLAYVHWLNFPHFKFIDLAYIYIYQQHSVPLPQLKQLELYQHTWKLMIDSWKITTID